MDYIVKDGEVIIVDEFTGRLMVGRRYSDGLHQAIEAKEGVTVERESKTLATITFQNYFRMYHKLSGMTGTAKTEEEEFNGIYKLDVVTIPTNRPMIRQGSQRRGVHHPEGQVGRRRRRDRKAPQDRPAGAGGHGLRGKERAAGQDAQACAAFPTWF